MWIRKQNVDSERSEPAEHEYVHTLWIRPKTAVKTTVIRCKDATAQRRWNNKMTECSFNALAFLFSFKAGLILQSYDSCLVGYLPLLNLFTLTPQVNTCITPTFSRALCNPAALYSARFLPPFIIVLCSQLMAVFVTMLSSSFILIWHQHVLQLAVEAKYCKRNESYFFAFTIFCSKFSFTFWQGL